jgi:hypothetical protein
MDYVRASKMCSEVVFVRATILVYAQLAYKMPSFLFVEMQQELASPFAKYALHLYPAYDSIRGRLGKRHTV